MLDCKNKTTSKRMANTYNAITQWELPQNPSIVFAHEQIATVKLMNIYIIKQ